MSSILNVFLTALLMYSQSPHTQNHQIIPLTHDSGDTRTELFGDQRNKPQPQMPLLQPCPRVSQRQLLKDNGHSTCSFMAPAPPPPLPCLLFHGSAPGTWAGQPGLCDSKHPSHVYAGTHHGHLCFVIPEIFPVPITTSFQSCPPLSHFGAQHLLPGVGQEVIVLRCARGGLGWALGRTSSQRGCVDIDEWWWWSH